MHRKKTFLLLLTAGLALFQCGCLATYLVKSGYEQMRVLNKREPIEKVLKSDKVDKETKRKLSLSLEARQFGIDQLGLKETNNYKTYVDIGRPYITHIVYVAEKYALENHHFKYPIVGKLPYKGFFTKEEADEEAKNFPKEKFDVIVRGVSAYSTLGWFDDPLLSTMISGDDFDLVNLILHESTHATLYIKSHADFNERLATFIGNTGTEIFYAEKEGADSATIKKMHSENEDTKLFSVFISGEIQELTKFYKNLDANLPMTEKDRLRELEFRKISEKFNKKILPLMKSGRYPGFGKAPLNNAVLLYFKTYMYDLEDFQKMFEKHDKNMSRFIAYCKSLEKSADPEKQLKSDLH